MKAVTVVSYLRDLPDARPEGWTDLVWEIIEASRHPAMAPIDADDPSVPG
jgi:hypothetical protein